jgi:hypothetical protein
LRIIRQRVAAAAATKVAAAACWLAEAVAPATLGGPRVRQGAVYAQLPVKNTVPAALAFRTIMKP